MSKLNFEQTAPGRRDVGGLSSKTLLALSIGLCVVWALFIHIRP